MAQTRRAIGGVGTNQYKIRGHPLNLPLPTPFVSFDQVLDCPWLRINLADPQCPEVLLIQVAAAPDDSRGSRHYDVVSNPRCPPEALDILSRRKPQPNETLGTVAAIKEKIAQHPNSSLKTLRHLATSAQTKVRLAVAENHNTPPDLLRVLAQDAEMRATIALRRDCPADVLLDLAQTGNHEIEHCLALRADTCPPEVLAVLSSSTNAQTRRILAENARDVPDILVKLAGDPKITVRRAVLANPQCPDHIRAIGVLGR